MFDFFKIIASENSKGAVEIYPNFDVRNVGSDLMIRGRDFYAIWDPDKKMWSTEEKTVIDFVDAETRKVYKQLSQDPKYADKKLCPKYMRMSRDRVIDEFHWFVQKQCRDQYRQLDEKIIFANDVVTKRDYASKKLSYELPDKATIKDIPAWDELIGTLYEEDERRKLEWAIGSIVAGDSKKIQKFIFIYGKPGSGKSTVLDILKELFEGYYCTFDAKKLVSNGSTFNLENFKTNPLIAIDPEARLDTIQDNTTLNSLVAHEELLVEEKYKSKYPMKFNTFLFIASNTMAKITDAKSGLIRRIIDVYSSEKTVEFNRYLELLDCIRDNELGFIAKYCLDVYNSLGINYYSSYYPSRMIKGTNPFYNFIQENAYELAAEEPIALKTVWTMYKSYCEKVSVKYPMSMMEVGNELQNYFDNYKDQAIINGKHVRSIYSGFHRDRFISDAYKEGPVAIPNNTSSWIDLRELNDGEKSQFDVMAEDWPAQLATKVKEIPKKPWAEVTTVLRNIDVHKVHYVMVPQNHIVIDFDLKDENGEKSLERNLKAAESWPPTYAETSKSGKGIHLHYIYTGDPNKLAYLYDEGIEVKVFSGNSSLRRRLSKCNNLPIAEIGENDGLPMKGETKMVNPKVIRDEKELFEKIKKNLNKEYHKDTHSSVNYIYKLLEDAYASGIHYSVPEKMREDIFRFANNSSNQAADCVKTVGKMKFQSDEPADPVDPEYDEIIFFDWEVYPNHAGFCYKKLDGPAVKVPYPTPEDCEELAKYKLVGFNNRKYDNHIHYARIHGYSDRMLYDLSMNIVSGNKDAMFAEAYNLSFTDIYDYSSKKQSLKKWEIELGIHHQECGYKWDEEVTDKQWEDVMDYCMNDVIATEAVWKATHEDFVAREILADLAGLNVNSTTNTLTGKIIFGDERNPQSEFVYTDLATIFPGYKYSSFGIDQSLYNEGTKIVAGKSLYRGEDPGEGGYVYAEPGMHGAVALLDIASMHPTSIEQLNLFGDEYTKRFSELKQARIAIKHKDYDTARKMFDGKLAKYLEDEDSAKALSNALKIPINSVYGLTSASFTNKFKDPRNIDNIVAKRGALFMIELKHAVQEKGYKVAHIKTDSIKIPDASPEIIQFVMDFGKKYGYDFEHEATYEKMCLVNEAVYIAKYKEPKIDKKTGKEIWWTATGTQFQVPYVFKTLFSKEPVEFRDMCETKSVTTALYLDMNEDLGEDEHDYRFVGRVGSFCPMKPGTGGGLLLREKDGKFSAATGTKGYRWMESEMVQTLGKEKDIDKQYYISLANDAKETIEKFGPFDWLISDEPYPDPSELPWY